jgi:hypothetical protein
MGFRVYLGNNQAATPPTPDPGINVWKRLHPKFAQILKTSRHPFAPALSSVTYDLSGSSAAHSAASASIRARVRFTASSAGNSTTSATIRARVRFAASSAAQSSAAATIRARVRFTGASSGSSATAASMTYLVGASADPGIRRNNQLPHSFARILKTARLPYAIPLASITYDLSGSSAAHSTTSATIRARVRFTAASSAQSSAAATIRARVRFAASSAGQSSAAASLYYVPPAVPVGNIPRNAQLPHAFARIRKTARIPAGVILSNVVHLTGVSNAQSTTNALMVPIATDPGVRAVYPPIPFVPKSLIFLHPLTQFYSAPVPHTQLSGSSAAQSSASATIRARVRFAATSSATSSTSATMRMRVRFAALSTAQSTTAATMTVTGGIFDLTASSAAHSTAYALLTYIGPAVPTPVTNVQLVGFGGGGWYYDNNTTIPKRKKRKKETLPVVAKPPEPDFSVSEEQIARVFERISAKDRPKPLVVNDNGRLTVKIPEIQAKLRHLERIHTRTRRERREREVIEAS